MKHTRALMQHCDLCAHQAWCISHAASVVLCCCTISLLYRRAWTWLSLHYSAVPTCRFYAGPSCCYCCTAHCSRPKLEPKIDRVGPLPSVECGSSSFLPLFFVCVRCIRNWNAKCILARHINDRVCVFLALAFGAIKTTTTTAITITTTSQWLIARGRDRTWDNVREWAWVPECLPATTMKVMDQ